MLKNLVVAISGSSGKIGLSFAHSILENGGCVILGDMNDRESLKVLKVYGSNRVGIFKKDLTIEKNILDFIKFGKKKFKIINAAVHCAYPRNKNWGKEIQDLKMSDLSINLSLQLGGAIIFSKVFMEYFLNTKQGNLIHISSIQGFASPKFKHYSGTNMSSPIEYSAIKAGIISITKYLAKYYKSKNIRVNCISPGGIVDNQPKNFLKKYNEECNFKGMLNPTDLNGALIFLLSNSSKFINGQNLIIDDGWSL